MDIESIIPEIVVAGHVCLDIIPALESAAWPQPGQLIRIGPASVSTGGVVANTGLALHRLGVPVRLMGKVGDDAFGHMLLELLSRQSPSLALEMILSSEVATSYSIVISPPGVDRSFMHCPGANDTFCDQDLRYDQLAGIRLMHFGYPPIMRKMYVDGGLRLQRLFQRVQGAGIATSLDMAQPDPSSDAGKVDWKELLRRVLPSVDIFIPSFEELLFMLDRPAFDQWAKLDPRNRVIDGRIVRRLGQQLVEMGATVAGIKLGDRGLYVLCAPDADRLGRFRRRLSLDDAHWHQCEIHSPCFQASKVVGTTGAGDCTVAGFLASLLRGEGPIDAANAATAVGAASVESADATAGVRPWSAVEQRIRAGWRRLSADIDWGRGITRIQHKSGALYLQEANAP